MNTKLLKPGMFCALALVLACVGTPAQAEELDEAVVLIEINATDGDVGFHALLDAEAWRWIRLDEPTGQKLFTKRPHAGLEEQGVTEIFFESSEPLCTQDPEEPDERVQTLAEFLLLFPEGEYLARAQTIEFEKLRSTAELTYNLPAAPDIEATEDATLSVDNAVIAWDHGDDLGESCHDQALVDAGIIADPAEVEVVRWEVTVEPADDEAADPQRVFMAQLKPEQMAVTIPAEFLQSYLDDGITEMKFEVGAMEESGNQTFSEGEFEIE